jgi:hypothetical protein
MIVIPRVFHTGQNIHTFLLEEIVRMFWEVQALGWALVRPENLLPSQMCELPAKKIQMLAQGVNSL